MCNRSILVTELRQTCSVWLPPTFLQLFLLLVPAAASLVGAAARFGWHCSALQQLSTRAPFPVMLVDAAAEAAPEKAGLPLQPLAKARNAETFTFPLVQTVLAPSRLRSYSEEELQEELLVTKGKTEEAKEEENAAEQMGEEQGQQQKLEDGSGKARVPHVSLSNQSSDNVGASSGAAAAHATGVMSVTSLQAGQKFVRGLSLFGQAALKLNHTSSNHSDNKTGKGLRTASQSQVLSRRAAADTNPTTVFLPKSSSGGSHSTWTMLEQLSASFHSTVMLALQDVGSAQLSLTRCLVILVASLVWASSCHVATEPSRQDERSN